MLLKSLIPKKGEELLGFSLILKLIGELAKCTIECVVHLKYFLY